MGCIAKYNPKRVKGIEMSEATPAQKYSFFRSMRRIPAPCSFVHMALFPGMNKVTRSRLKMQAAIKDVKEIGTYPSPPSQCASGIQQLAEKAHGHRKQEGPRIARKASKSAGPSRWAAGTGH